MRGSRRPTSAFGMLSLLLIAACAPEPIRPLYSAAPPFTLGLDEGMWWEYTRVLDWPYRSDLITDDWVRLEVTDSCLPPSRIVELDELTDHGDIFALWEEDPDCHVEVPPHYMTRIATSHACRVERSYLLPHSDWFDASYQTQYLTLREPRPGALHVAYPKEGLVWVMMLTPGAILPGRVYKVAPVEGTDVLRFTPCWLADSNLGLLDLTLSVVRYDLDGYPFDHRTQEQFVSMLRVWNTWEYGCRMHQEGARLVVPGAGSEIVAWGSPTWGWKVTGRDVTAVTRAGDFRCLEITRLGKGYRDPVRGTPLYRELWSEGIGLVARIDRRVGGDGIWVLSDCEVCGERLPSSVPKAPTP